jgi:NAD(P)-dependent dehydrogenase (short-subunit alcohol dehydrogenase family)
MSKLKGKVAVITGRSSGTGLATAKRFVEEGAYVFIMGRRRAELDKAVAEIGKNVTAAFPHRLTSDCALPDTRQMVLRCSRRGR